MKRRELLSKIAGSTAAVFLYGEFQSNFSNSKYFPCILERDIPKGFSKEKYFQTMYELHSFKEIKKIVEEFKQSGKLISEHRIIENNKDRWFATFRTKQDYLDFMNGSLVVDLQKKDMILADNHGLKARWILPT